MRQLKITQQITQREEKSVNLYFQEVNKYPMISMEEEVALSLKIHNGDKEALKRLVEANLRFVISVAKQYQNQGLSFADLINEGNVGLVRAAEKFDETRGFKFISYAVWWIRQSIMQALSEQTRIVRLPLNRLASIKKISNAINMLEQQFEREPTNDELAEYLEENEDFIEENKSIRNRQVVSFDKPLTNDGNGDLTLYDLVYNENLPSPDNKLLAESLKINLLRALNKLSYRESEIISLSYGLNNHETLSLSEISSIMNITGERVRQIKNAGLYKLKKILSKRLNFFDIV